MYNFPNNLNYLCVDYAMVIYLKDTETKKDMKMYANMHYAINKMCVWLTFKFLSNINSSNECHLTFI